MKFDVVAPVVSTTLRAAGRSKEHLPGCRVTTDWQAPHSDRNPGATKRIITNRHGTSRARVRTGRDPAQNRQIDTERHRTTRTYVDMESNKDLK